jgi:hypothetical protein
LRVASVLQFVSVGIEEQRSDVATGNIGGLVYKFPAVVANPRATHAGTL